MTSKLFPFKPFSADDTYLFGTLEGYGEGKIVNTDGRYVQVRLTRHSQRIIASNQEVVKIPIDQMVRPSRENVNLLVPISCKQASGYFHPGFYEKILQNIPSSFPSKSLPGLSPSLGNSPLNASNLSSSPSSSFPIPVPIYEEQVVRKLSNKQDLSKSYLLSYSGISGVSVDLRSIDFISADLTSSSESSSKLKLSDSDQSEHSEPLKKLLTLHNYFHRKLLQQIFNILNTHLIRYIRAEIRFNELPFDEILWMLNVLFYIDDYPQININVLTVIIQNFLSDYINLSPTSWIKSPINYLLESQDIQGILWETQMVIFVPTHQEDYIYSL